MTPEEIDACLDAGRLTPMAAQRWRELGEAPVTSPTLENGCWVFRTSWADQQRIAAYNWRMINLMAAELMKRREGK